MITRSCVVTGAGGVIGKAIVMRLLADGWKVVGLDLTFPEGAMSGLTADEAPEWVELIGDVADPASHADAAILAGEGAQLEGYVNCAGYNILGSVVDLPVDELERGVAVNLLGMFHGTAAACRAMLPHRRGSIVNISSIHGKVGFPGFAAYAMSKGGIEALSRQVAAEYIQSGIRCNVVAPGLIQSTMNRELLKVSPDPERLQKAWDHLTPMGRWGTPEDVSASVAFFLSDESSYITGAVLGVDGGAMTIAPGQIA